MTMVQGPLIPYGMRLNEMLYNNVEIFYMDQSRVDKMRFHPRVPPCHGMHLGMILFSLEVLRVIRPGIAKKYR